MLRLLSRSHRQSTQKRARVLAVFFAQASIAFAFLFYPAFLHLGANNGWQNLPAKEQFDFCELLRGKPAQSCGVTSRFLIRAVQSGAGDQRACVQAAGVSKFLLHPLRKSTWDKTSLRLYASYYAESGLAAKRIKARFAQFMLRMHHEIDAKCNPPA